jgi:hypothetical protein
VDSYSLLGLNGGQNHDVMSSSCRDQFNVGNSLSTTREGATAGHHNIRHDRVVRYVPLTGYRGKDSFSYNIRHQDVWSKERGLVEVETRVCRGFDNDCGNDKFAFSNHQRHSRN